MKHLVRTRVAGQLLLSAAGLLLTHTAFAQSEGECDVDADCEPGFACEVTGASGGCSVGPCDEEGNCPESVCETFEYRSCVPGPCEDDSDCSEGMVCHTETYGFCTSPAWICDDGEDGDCRPSAEPSCEEYTESKCTPVHALPCTADVDCGEGFRCVEQSYFECEDSGGDYDEDATDDPAVGGPVPTPGPTPAPAGGSTGGSNTSVSATSPSPEWGDSEGDEEPWTPPVCKEVPSGHFSCELLELPCDSDADCPSAMECQDNYRVCSGGGTTGGSAMGNITGAPVDSPPVDAGAAVALPDGPNEEGDVDWAEPVEVVCGVPEGLPAKVCRPRYYGGGGWSGGNTTGAGGTAPGGVGVPWEQSAGTDGSDTGTGTDPRPGQAEDGDSSGNMGAGNGSTGTEPPDVDDDEDHAAGNPSDWWRGRRGRHGCSVGGTAQPSDALSLLLGVGLALGLRRRRR